MSSTVSIGKMGEEKAASFLEQKGWKILARNYRSRFGEVDLVCRDGNEIVFVEVKARNSSFFGDGAEAVGPQKMQRIIKTAYSFLKEFRFGDAPFRFDVISIMLGEDKPIRHIPNAFP